MTHPVRLVCKQCKREFVELDDGCTTIRCPHCQHNNTPTP